MNNSPLRRNKFKEDIIYTPNPPKIGDKNNKSSLIVVNSCQTFQTSQKPLTNFGMKDYWYYTNLIEAVRTLLCLCYSFLRSPCCFYKSFFYSQIILCSLWLSQFLCLLQFLVLLSICHFQMCLRFFCILLLVFTVFFFCDLFNWKNMQLGYFGYMVPLKKKQELVYSSEKIKMPGILWKMYMSSNSVIFLIWP